MASIGGVKPGDIKSAADNHIIYSKNGVPEDVPYEEQEKNQKMYISNPKNLQVGDYVYLDFPKIPFAKGYDTPNNQLYIINSVNAGKRPVLFSLKDLKDDVLPGYYYKEQLIKGEAPSKEKFFKVERILKKKRINNTIYYFVKYQHYDNRFNQWIPKENLITGNK